MMRDAVPVLTGDSGMLAVMVLAAIVLGQLALGNAPTA